MVTNNEFIKKRRSSIELLRILLMFMIIIHHSIVHGLGLMGLGHDGTLPMYFDDYEKPIATFVNCLCICAVNCFVLISGFFSIKTTIKKFISIVLTVLFYTFIGTSLIYLVQGNLRQAISSMMILSHQTYWFVNAYIYLMLFAPVLNSMFESFSKKYIQFIIIILIFISCYLGFIWNNPLNQDGYNLFQVIMMYCIGRYLAIYPFKISRIKSLIIYLSCSAFAGGLMYILWIRGFYTLSWHIVCYNNPLLILSAIGLFLFFNKINIHSNFVNVCAKSAFAIYLIQSSMICESLYYNYLNNLHPKVGGYMADYLRVVNRNHSI